MTACKSLQIPDPDHYQTFPVSPSQLSRALCADQSENEPLLVGKTATMRFF